MNITKDDIKEDLVSNGAGISDLLFIESIEKGKYKITSLILLDPLVNVCVYDNYAIRFVCKNCNIKMLKLLLKDGRADPSDLGSRALLDACREGHIEVVRLLLKDGRADPGAVQNHCLKLVCEAGYIEIVKLLLEDKRVDVHSLNCCAIISAFQCNHYNIVKLLIPKIDMQKINRLDRMNSEIIPHFDRTKQILQVMLISNNIKFDSDADVDILYSHYEKMIHEIYI